MRTDYKDIKGSVFGYLTVISIASDKPVKWICRCECGNLTIVRGNILRTGKSKSCGCKTGEMISKGQTTHGMSKSDEYSIWIGMKGRCYNKGNSGYKDYGERGISVCSRWLDKDNGFENFIIDMGLRPDSNYSIERINNDKGYTPDNCRWETQFSQSRNHRRNHWLELNGERMVLTDWAHKIGITPSALQSRLKNMPRERALTMEANRDKKRYIEAGGKRLTLIEWADELGLSKSQIQRRLKEYPAEIALGFGFREISAPGEKSVNQLTLDGEFVAEFKSLSEAGRQTGIDFRSISAVLNGKQKTTKGYKWEYKCKT